MVQSKRRRKVIATNPILTVICSDLLCFLPVLLIVCIIKIINYKLVWIDKNKQSYFVTVNDFCDAGRGLHGRGYTDNLGIMLMASHKVFVASIMYLCVHFPACLVLQLARAACPGITDWSAALAAARICSAVAGCVAVSAGLMICDLHRCMRPKMEFAEAVRMWLSEAYQDDGDRIEAASLIFKLMEMAHGVPEVLEPTPEQGKQAVVGLLEHMDGVQIGGASWMMQLTQRELEIHKELLEVLAK